MGSRVFLVLGLLMAIVLLLVSSEVPAGDVADTFSDDNKKNAEVTAETNRVDDAKYDRGYGGGRGGYGGGGGRGGYGGGGRGGYGGGGRGGYGGGGRGGYGGGGRGGYGGGGGGGYGGGCRYGCCGRGYYGSGCRCCTYAGEEAVVDVDDAPTVTKPQN